MHASKSGVLSPAASPGDSRNENTSKAYKILGTTDASVHETHSKRDDKRRSRRPSFMRAPEIKSQKSGGFVPFPTAAPETTIPPQHLRVRASSPLLGHEFRPDDAPGQPMPASTKKIHQSGSASALFSYFSSRDSSANTIPGIGVATSDFGPAAEGKPESRQSAESGSSLRQPKGPMKDSKRKMRPPRIDLSLLFPKPKATAEPLLSPQRLVASPSAISIVSEHPVTKAKNIEDHAAGTKLAKTPPHLVKTTDQTYGGRAPEASSYETKTSNWLDPSLERTVRASEMDLALQKLQQDSRRNTKGRSNRSQSRSQGQDKRRTGDSRAPDDNLWKVTSNSSGSEWSKETYLSPKARSRQSSHRVSNHSEPRRPNLHASAALEKCSVPKKSSRTTLKTADLNSSSVLCLSSSEDEDDDEDLNSDRLNRDRNARDSVATYGEFEAEICTASAAQATKGTLRSIDQPMSVTSRGSRPSQRLQSARRDVSQSSAERSSYMASCQSRRSSDIPTISEPEFFHGDPIFNHQRQSQLRKPPSASQKETNRRSRVIAVTRQEEHLLEAMRQRKGKITPSIFQESRFNSSLEPDQGSMLSVPSRDSFYGSDMSFLRLSPAFPPKSVQANASRNEREGSVCQSTFSDEEQRTINSFPSPRASLAFSEGLSSPSTSAASPLTPTLPIHRFSPIPSQGPPPRRPIPAVPQDKRRHSRRRTDSSEAIVLEEPEEPKQRDELPMWTLRWNNDNGTMTAVH
ncbi:hypothetical protein AtubIFM55763_000630 [Aspergillus tubingensis]|uniref:uncharacterized protein n=1 Tax=Aspergillus tubingensis TaxID=5068 RepID=UPI001579DFEA|nr:leucine Rich repeat family protein [Aspergillus tubingensis]GFN18501.1 leucine Rich repeat family protein [Aspergillus tubingensis]GLA78739.1 hypothetical protein AtubIFM55763_000630 [Aspergillus tubingensis]GLB00655.1 hypothetical protein AtubIFM57143_009707 [Aspergillus tubingensis]